MINEKKFNVNAKDKNHSTALSYAVESDPNVKMVKFLLEKGADKTIKYSGKLPLEIAQENDCKKIIALLSQE